MSSRGALLLVGLPAVADALRVRRFSTVLAAALRQNQLALEVWSDPAKLPGVS